MAPQSREVSSITRVELLSVPAPLAETVAVSQAVVVEQVPSEQVPEEAVAPEAVVEEAPEVIAKEPTVTTEIVEGDIDRKTDVEEKEETREDGTVVRSRVTTTKQVQTVTEIVLTDGVESDRHVSERHVGTEVEEEILELGPGVTEPTAENTKTEKSVEQLEESLEDGTSVKRSVSITRVELISVPAPIGRDSCCQPGSGCRTGA